MLIPDTVMTKIALRAEITKMSDPQWKLLSAAVSKFWEIDPPIGSDRERDIAQEIYDEIMKSDEPFGFNYDGDQLGNGVAIQKWMEEYGDGADMTLDPNKMYSWNHIPGQSRKWIFPSKKPVEYDLKKLIKDLRWILGFMRS